MINLKWRSVLKGLPPQPIKLDIPGWAGENLGHSDGDKPQPWHCPPFVEGSTYGLELIYPFETECHVKNIDGNVVFEGDFSQERASVPREIKLPPFMMFAPNHFGFTSSLDLQPPAGHVIRLEPHPRFYTDTTGTVPVAITGHIQGEWWPKIFFVVFKSPYVGQTYIFRKNEPYAQILILPKKVNYQIEEMSGEEKGIRHKRDERITKYISEIAKNRWFDHIKNRFDDKYKVLSKVFATQGVLGVDNFLQEIENQVYDKKRETEASVRKKFKRRLF